MRVFLDGQSLDGAAETLAAALELGRRACESTGRIVIDVFLDEEKLDADQMREAEDLELPDSTVKLVTADRREVVLETYDHVTQALDGLTIMHEEIAAEIQSGQTAGALEKLGETIQVWHQVQEAVRSASALGGIDLDELARRQSPIGEAIESLSDRLKEIRHALAHQDWVALSDCLGYEMEPVTNEWRQMIEELGRRVESVGAATGKTDKG